MFATVLAVAVPGLAQKVILPDRVYGAGASREIEVETSADGSKTTNVTVRDKDGSDRGIIKARREIRQPPAAVNSPLALDSGL